MGHDLMLMTSHHKCNNQSEAMTQVLPCPGESHTCNILAVRTAA